MLLFILIKLLFEKRRIEIQLVKGLIDKFYTKN